MCPLSLVAILKEGNVPLKRSYRLLKLWENLHVNLKTKHGAYMKGTELVT
mgnify:CR=1 FL=1